MKWIEINYGGLYGLIKFIYPLMKIPYPLLIM